MIAREKAGIIKPGVPTVTGILRPEAARVVRSVCNKRESALNTLRLSEFSIRGNEASLDFDDGQAKHRSIRPSLLGEHQLHNCALVLKTLGVLKGRGEGVPARAVKEGLRSTKWPGRFHIIKGTRARPETVLDVCHNESGIKAFAGTFKQVYPKRKAHIIVGFVKRKPHQLMVDELSPLAQSFCVVRLRSGRTMDSRTLLEALDWHGIPVSRAGSLKVGLRRVLKASEQTDIMAIVGSHYLVGEYLSYLK